MIANGSFLGVRPSTQFIYAVIASSVGAYFKGGEPTVSLWVTREYVRAAPGGTGEAKCGGNYAGSLVAQAEAIRNGCDQVVHDVAIQNLPVRFAMDRAGLVGADGATHAGSFDLAYLCTLPNFVVMAAADEAELVHMDEIVKRVASPNGTTEAGLAVLGREDVLDKLVSLTISAASRRAAELAEEAKAVKLASEATLH